MTKKLSAKQNISCFKYSRMFQLPTYQLLQEERTIISEQPHFQFYIIFDRKKPEKQVFTEMQLISISCSVQQCFHNTRDRTGGKTHFDAINQLYYTKFLYDPTNTDIFLSKRNCFKVSEIKTRIFFFSKYFNAIVCKKNTP